MSLRTERRLSKSGVFIFVIVILALAADVILAAQYVRYQNETDRLRKGMSKAQRDRADAVVAAERHRMRVAFALIRQQARGDKVLHLSVNVDSNHMVLERDGVKLREMDVRIGPERITPPTGDSAISVSMLGKRTVRQILGPRDKWAVPASVFRDRGIEAPKDRAIAGALGEHAILLNDGTVIYAVPDKGPLADSAYVLPGSLQLQAADLEAISENLRRGMSVYFYR
jgi:hypothetical protein